MAEAAGDPRETHRRFAIDLFNRSWDLIDQPRRTAAEDDELLAVAFASRWHWGQAGGPEETSVGDHQIAKAAALLGYGDLAVRFATRCLEATEAAGWGGWRLAAAYEGMARACAAAGDGAGRAGWLAKAEAALGDIADPDERAVIAAQVSTVPPASG